MLPYFSTQPSAFSIAIEGMNVEQHDLERIARATLKELGLSPTEVAIFPDGRPGQWRLEVRGARSGPGTVNIKCGKGTTPQWVREQIFNQFNR